MVQHKRGSATMGEVARLAGVSPATVSRTLSGTRSVDPELQSRVLAAAEELGYRVNLVGRALRQRRSSVVGMVVPDFDNPFFSTLAHYLSEAFGLSETDLLIYSAHGSLETERRGVLSFIGRQVDALVLVPVHEVESQASVELATASAVTVQLDRRVPRSGGHFVGCSNGHGMRMVAEHIADHVDARAQPVMYVGAEPTSSTAHDRLDGFRTWFGQDAPALLGSFDAQWGHEAADRIIASGLTSGTIVTAADVIALGVLGRLKSAGFRVPEDFRIIGFDGIGIARLAYPTLTTVRQPFAEMAARIRDLLDSHPSDHTSKPVSVRLRPGLIIGDTSPTSSR